MNSPIYLPWRSRLARARLSRRGLLRGSAVGAIGLAAAGLVGCGDDDDDDDDDNGAANGGDPDANGNGGNGGGGLSTVGYGFPFGAPFAGLLAEHYVADDRGYFAEEGLEESILYQTALLPLIAAGTLEYARVTPVNFLNAQEAGQPLKAVFQGTYAFVFGIRVPEDSEITEFSADAFRGQAIGITEFAGGEVPMVRALLKSIGLEEGTDVELIPTSGTTQQPTVDNLQTGAIAAFAGSHVDFAAIETFGLPLRDVTPEEVVNINADDATGVGADYLAENRDEVVRFCRATAKGLIFTIENPRAAAEIGIKEPYAPDSGTIEEVETFIRIFVNDRATPPEGVSYGEMPIDGWEAYQNFLLEGRTGGQDDPLAFEEPVDVSEIIDNSLVPEIMDFDLEAIRQEARDYVSES
ncbi:MAG: hypothetical protein GEU28_03520 [Dehalococcoidia bacterium]|nr:hypothetical protein [Dehalococcoidia bacterium]